MIINGIGDFVERSDTIDRCLILRLPAIPDDARRREQEFWSDFRADWPRLMGALLKAVAGGLKMLTEVDLAASPRMADFAQWGEAVMRGLGFEPGSFLDRYHDNRCAASDSALDDCEVAQALRGMMEPAGGNWRGTASELLTALAGHARPNATKTVQWPKTPQAPVDCAAPHPPSAPHDRDYRQLRSSRPQPRDHHIPHRRQPRRRRVARWALLGLNTAPVSGQGADGDAIFAGCVPRKLFGGNTGRRGAGNAGSGRKVWLL